MKKAMMFTMVLLMSFILSACDEFGFSIDSEVQVKSLEIDGLKASYDVDTFDVSDLKLNVTKVDGSVESIDVTIDMVSYDESVDFKEEGDYQITVTYEDVLIPVDIHVVDFDLVSTFNARVVGLLYDFLYANGATELSDVSKFMEKNGIEMLNPQDYVEFKVESDVIFWKYLNDDQWNELNELDFVIDDYDFFSEQEYMYYKEMYPRYEGTYNEYLLERVTEKIELSDYHIVTFQYIDCEELITVQKIVLDGEKISPIDFDIPDEFEFEGWFYGETEFLFDETKVEEDLVLTAMYSTEEYTITFIDETGILSNTELSIGFGYQLLLASQKDTNGMRFVGWFFEDGTKLESGIFTYNKDITVYAKWVIVSDMDIINQFPNDEKITISFGVAYSSAHIKYLESMIDEFEVLYPNIEVQIVSTGGYDDLRHTVMSSIAHGDSINVVLGYPEHMVEYQKLDALQPLAPFASDELVGIDLTNYIPSYLEENYELGEKLYSLPFLKSTDVLIYNKTVFDSFGYTFDENQVLTFEEINQMASTVMGTSGCEHMINYDSGNSLFFNTARQWENEGVINENQISFDSDLTTEMLTTLQTMYASDVLTLPIEWDTSYGSNNFLNGDVCMTVSSSVGVYYNLPYYRLDEEEQFEVGILPIPQFEGKENSALQRGPNVAILNGALEEELASWLLIKYLTNDENTARLALQTKYLPVTFGGYNTSVYQDYINNPEEGNEYYVMAYKTAFSQYDYFGYEPVYDNVGALRNEIRSSMDMLYVGNMTIEEFIEELNDNVN